jgi:HAE1 family hydrophobic/amphiphilic exporter-1
MRHRFVMVLLIVTVIASTFPLFKRIGKNFLPSDDESQFEVVVRAPEGYSLLATSTLIERMAKDLRQIPDIIDILTTVGENGQNAVNAATIYIKLKPLEARVQDQFYYMKLAREIVKQYPKELRTSIQPVGLFGAAGRANADVQYLLSGPDLQKLTEYSQKVLEKLRAVPNVFDPDTSLILGKPELRVVIDRERADDLGVKAADIAQALNVLVAGQEISTFNVGKEQYEIRVRAAGENRANRLDLTRMVLASSKVGTVTLDKVARLEAGTGPATIEHFNRQRQIILFANVSADGSQSDVLNKIAQFFQEIQPEPGYIGAPVGRSKELARTGYYFAMAFVLSFIFMYMVLAAQFESFIHPITILLTLPLAIPFGILAMFLANQTVNIYCGLGLLVLFGVVKKNAILQIDHTNGLRQQGMGRYEAIMQANRDRLRPILMTTVALVAGMIPLVFATGPGSGTNRSIGVLVVGGQSFCLLLTLLAVPVLYSLFEDLGDGFRRLIGGTYQGMTQTIAQDVATKPFAQSTKQKD